MPAQFNLLLVDDDEFIRLCIGESLSNSGYSMDYALDGQEAWDKLNAVPDAYDLVLLDKNMPRLNGIELLKRIKADSRFSGLPVVMLTRANKPEDVVEGLAVGAYYYLTKPVMQDVLLRVAGNALHEAHMKRELHALLGQQKTNLGLLHRAEFVFRTLREARDLALLLAEASLNSSRTLNGYSELLINAVEHGNLGISYAEKGSLLKDGLWADEIAYRLNASFYAERVVKVLFERTQDSIVVTISDQGEGFDWQSYLEFNPARAFDLHGRGIALSRALCFDSLEYVGNGNTVVTTVRL